MHPTKIAEHFGASETVVLDAVVPAYETTRICRNVRALDAEWEAWDGTDSPVETRRGMDGAVDLASSQLRCHDG